MSEVPQKIEKHTQSRGPQLPVNKLDVLLREKTNSILLTEGLGMRYFKDVPSYQTTFVPRAQNIIQSLPQQKSHKSLRHSEAQIRHALSLKPERQQEVLIGLGVTPLAAQSLMVEHKKHETEKLNDDIFKLALEEQYKLPVAEMRSEFQALGCSQEAVDSISQAILLKKIHSIASLKDQHVHFSENESIQFESLPTSQKYEEIWREIDQFGYDQVELFYTGQEKLRSITSPKSPLVAQLRREWDIYEKNHPQHASIMGRLHISLTYKYLSLQRR